MSFPLHAGGEGGNILCISGKLFFRILHMKHYVWMCVVKYEQVHDAETVFYDVMLLKAS